MYQDFSSISETIINGKLDAYLVQPKDVLLSAITGDVGVSALGDLLYGYIMLFIYGITLKNALMFTLFSVCGGLILVSIGVILGSLSFWFRKSDMISDTGNSIMVNFASYPSGIFKGVAKVLLYTILPVGVYCFMPVDVIRNFNIYDFFIIIVTSITFIDLAYVVFYKGLKRYSSSNLMISRI